MAETGKGQPSRIHKLRRDPRRDLRLWLRQSSDTWQAAVDLPAVWVALLLIVGTWALLPSGFLFAPKAVPGAIATRDYVANRDLLLPDEETTEEKQRRAREEVPPLYDFDPEVIAERDRRWSELFARGRRLLAVEAAAGEARRGLSADELAKALASQTKLEVTAEQAGVLLRRGFSAELEDRVRGVSQQALKRGIVANKGLLLENRLRGVVLRSLATGAEHTHFDLFGHLGYPDEVREFLEAEVRDWARLSTADRRATVDLLLENVTPNLHFNRSETLARQQRAAAAVAPVFNQVRKGQVIVRKGDQIDATAARLVSEMRGGDRRSRRQIPPLLGTFFLLALAGAVVWLGLRSERGADQGRSRRRVFGEALVLLLISLLGAKFCFLVAGALSNSFEAPPLNSVRSYAYAIPFASLALLTTLLLGRHAALLLSLTFSILMSRLAPDGDPQWVVVYAMAGSLAAVFALDQYQFKQRLVMLRVGMVVGGVNLVVILILQALSGAERGPVQIGFDLVCGLAGGLLVTAVASFALPILESLLAITTDIKLVELSNTNLPLLRRLAFEAPGTFQHSLMVANLAKEGCEAIGADPVLAYAGGLYHDLGKVFRPDYFIENQRQGQNRHDKLLPSMSALILINHVKEGVELARAHGLPQPILDAIEQHHGTRLIKYFYNRALEQCGPEAGEVREEKYRYPGPRPRNKVMGVLMLADGVEAASRTLVEPTPAKIRTLIRTIVDDCLRDGQLDKTDLTLSDLRVVAESFLRVLATIFHQRIDYPGFDFNAEPRRERRPAAEAVRAS